MPCPGQDVQLYHPTEQQSPTSSSISSGSGSIDAVRKAETKRTAAARSVNRIEMKASER